MGSPHATVEELYLLQKLIRALGSDNVDFRLRQSDFSADATRTGAPWLGVSVAEFAKLQRVLVVGSFLRKDHPLLAQRLRQSAKRGAQVSIIHPTADDLLMPLHERAIVAPSKIADTLAQVVKALAEIKAAPPPSGVAGVTVSPAARRIAESLASSEPGKAGVFLGNLATQHAEAAALARLAQEIARLAGAAFGTLGEAANSVGGYLAGAVPKSGANARSAFESPRKAYVLLHAEPELDCANPAAARAALASAETVIALTPFKGTAKDYADVLLPIAPFAETSGTFVNTEGRAQSFYAVTKPAGETRPGWKVLRVLGNLVGADGFEFESSEAVKAEALAGDIAARLNNTLAGNLSLPAAAAGVERVADVPIYFADALVRRAPSLQKTADAKAPVVRVSAATAAQLGLAGAHAVRVVQGQGSATLPLELDDTVAAGCARVSAAHPTTATLGALCGTLTLERA